MKILNSETEDVDKIFKIYEDATAYQKTVNNKSWKGFERALVEKEISENRHFKIMEGDEIACSFVITFSDPIIWKNTTPDNAIYLHRIATNSSFRGRSYLKRIVEWSLKYGKEKDVSFIRLDTHSGNEKINRYYISCGFSFKGVSEIEWTADLPEHYREGPFSLFEIVI